MEIIERGGQWSPPRKRPETQKTDRFFSPDDTLTRKDCISFDDRDYGQYLTTNEGTFRRIGRVMGQIDKKYPPKFLDLLVTVGKSEKYFLRDDGERIPPPKPNEIDEPYSHQPELGEPRIIPVDFQKS